MASSETCPCEQQQTNQIIATANRDILGKILSLHFAKTEHRPQQNQ